jgi:hypothetical protein
MRREYTLRFVVSDADTEIVQLTRGDFHRMRDMCYEKLGKKDVSLSMTDRPRCQRKLGTCFKKYDKVEESEYFIIWLKSYSLDTMAHELAHVWEWENSHGPHWYALKEQIKSWWKEMRGEA